jgi:hypothetical protein
MLVKSHHSLEIRVYPFGIVPVRSCKSIQRVSFETVAEDAYVIGIKGDAERSGFAEH